MSRNSVRGNFWVKSVKKIFVMTIRRCGFWRINQINHLHFYQVIWSFKKNCISTKKCDKSGAEKARGYTWLIAVLLIKKKLYARSHAFTNTKHPNRDVCPSILWDTFGTIFRRDTKSSLKVPLGFPGSDRLRPASQYFSNFLSRSYGTRSIMTSREQSSFSLPRRLARFSLPQALKTVLLV